MNRDKRYNESGKGRRRLKKYEKGPKARARKIKAYDRKVRARMVRKTRKR